MGTKWEMSRADNRRGIVEGLSDRAKAYLSSLGYDEFDKILTFRLDYGIVRTVRLIESRAKRIEER